MMILLDFSSSSVFAADVFRPAMPDSKIPAEPVMPLASRQCIPPANLWSTATE
jgi:hypothetical protein